ncbi:MAG TPA: proteasome subunit alpha [Acidobacteriota bacterium]|jgi:proteasome alpha subunit
MAMELTQFISPKQLLEIKREIVEEALAKSNPIVALQYKGGILLMAENPSRSLNKISEIYDRVAFAGTGLYTDYEKLRKAGVQYADLRGYTYSRRDVRGKPLASEYSTILGEIFSREPVPLEVEILLAEVGDSPEGDRMFRIPFSGGLVEETGFAVLGDIAKDEDSGKYKRGAIRKFLQDSALGPDTGFEAALRAGHQALGIGRGSERLRPENIEVALLDRTTPRPRKFQRLNPDSLSFS